MIEYLHGPKKKKNILTNEYICEQILKYFKIF